jgi:LacI family transcriptional regulator
MYSGLLAEPDTLAADLDALIDGGEYPEPSAPTTTVRIVRSGENRRQAPRVFSDMRAIGACAADHLINAGYVDLLAFGDVLGHRVGAQTRVQGFVDRAAEHGRTARVFWRGPRTERQDKWRVEDQLDDLADLLLVMVRPIGLFAPNVALAWRAHLVIHRAGLNIPQELGLIAGSDDSSLLTSTNPTISAIDRNEEEVAYVAAQTIDAMLAGRIVPHERLIAPLGVVERQSTQGAGSADPMVDRAVAFIWDHVADRVAVADLQHLVPMSQRTLLRRFKGQLGRTPQQEINRSRVETAKRLLASTALPLVDVATQSGLADQSQLCREIRKDTGMTASAYRNWSGRR